MLRLGLLPLLIVAGCSTDSGIERPDGESPAVQPPAAHPPKASRDAHEHPPQPPAHTKNEAPSTAPSTAQPKAATVRAAPSALLAVPSAPRPEPRKSTQARKPRQPRHKYASWAGIAVRRLPYADYQALLPHLKGIASWYGPTFHGKKTANGEVYNQFELTAAHLKLPMGTRIMVENQQTRARVWVRINDRGPYKKRRILDLSRAAAARLGMIKKGTAPVRIAVVRWPEGMNPAEGMKAYGQYVVQIAAFPDALKAEGERRGLKSRFGEVNFKLNRTPKGLYSIWAGPFDEEHAALRIAATLRKGGVISLVRAHRK